MTLQPPQPNRYSYTDSQEKNYWRIQVRQDTNANWLKNDPTPASGEWCYSIGTEPAEVGDPANNDPPATEELAGSFILDGRDVIWECKADCDGADPPNCTYQWEETALEYVVPAASECVKIGTGDTRWSQLPWLGARGPQGGIGPPGRGISIKGSWAGCGPPQIADADDGDVYIAQCIELPVDEQADCFNSGCDGHGWVWSEADDKWVDLGPIKGPPGNNVSYEYEDWVVGSDGETEFIIIKDIQVDASIVTVNGVILRPDQYTLTTEKLTILDNGLIAGDVLAISSFCGAIAGSVVETLTTADVATMGNRPAKIPPVTRSEIHNQQQANWYLLDAVDALNESVGGEFENYATVDYVDQQIAEIPPVDLSGYATEDYVDQQIAAIPPVDLSAYATQEWVLDQSYITEQVVTDAVDAQAQAQANIDRQQNEAIQQNADKVAALEGSTTDARYKCSPRTDPSLGEFVLTSILNEKVAQWDQCKYIKMTQTDFENNTHDFSRIYPGDFIRLAVSLTNNATYKVNQVMQGSQSVTLDVDFEARAGESMAYEGGIYDFTHFKSLNVNDFATINYVDQRDSATLSSANADAATKYVPKTGGAFTGEVTGKTPSQASSKAFATVEYVNESLGSVTTDVPNANTTTKGIDFRGQCGTHSGSNPTLKKGQLSFDASTGKLYIGTG